jgi:PPK2 family polyphosphate:nucleotide phosphotransferase
VIKPVDSPYLVPFDGSFRVQSAPTKPPDDAGDEKDWEKKLKKRNRQIAKLQRVLYAHDRFALLLLFQAMDAAGKDSGISAVTTGVNPAGFMVYSFKQPSAEELDHDFLWRSSLRLPERGRIGIHNRSYYEEVLAVRVHPEFLHKQKLPTPLPPLDQLWRERHESIRSHELHLFRSGILVIKFWLNLSQEEQHARFAARIETPKKNWKFSPTDVVESRYWDDYMRAYEDALNATSREWAPWYAIPADSKPYARMCIADIIAKTLKSLPLEFPVPNDKDRARMVELGTELLGQSPGHKKRKRDEADEDGGERAPDSED